MATLSPQSILDAGTAPTFAAAAGGGDACITGAGILLAVTNGDASSKTVTVATPGTVNGLAIADRAVVVAAGTTAYIPIGNDYRDPSTGLAAITYSAVTSVTVAVLRINTR